MTAIFMVYLLKKWTFLVTKQQKELTKRPGKNTIILLRLECNMAYL